MPESTPVRSDAIGPRVLIADDQPDILEALRLNVSQMAKALGLSRGTLYRRLRRYGV